VLGAGDEPRLDLTMIPRTGTSFLPPVCRDPDLLFLIVKKIKVLLNLGI